MGKSEMESDAYPETIPGIKEDESLALEAVARLHSLAVERFNERRNLEWRVAFTLWAGLVLAANALNEAEPMGSDRWFVLGGLVVIAVAHGAWEWFAIRPAAQADRAEGYSLALVQRNMLGLPPGEKMTPEGEAGTPSFVVSQGWQVLITAALCVFVAVIAL